MDLIRFLVVRWLLRAARRLLADYVARHHPNVHRRAALAADAIDLALAGVENAARERIDEVKHPMHRRHDEVELGSDEQLTPSQRDQIAARLAADRDRVRAEEQRTVSQPVDDDGSSHHSGGV